MTHLSTQNTSYGQKKGRKSKCQFDSRPLKVKNCKALIKGYNFASNLTSIRGLKNIMGFQSHENPNFDNFGTLNLGVPKQNNIWV